MDRVLALLHRLDARLPTGMGEGAGDPVKWIALEGNPIGR